MSARRRFAEAVRSEPVDVALAALLVGAEVAPGLDVEASLAELDRLAAGVRLPAQATPAQSAEALQASLGADAGFGGSPEDYDDLRSSLLHEVLRRRRGLPLLLSVVWVEVARRCGVPAHCVGLPGHVVVRLGGPDGEHVLVDPFAGGRVLVAAELDEKVRAATGGPLRPEHLRPLDGADLLMRLLTNVRALTTRSSRTLEAARTRLWAVELTLLLPGAPPGLHRERGELMVRLGDHVGGAQVLEAYAGAALDDAEAEEVRREARQARARLN